MELLMTCFLLHASKRDLAGVFLLFKIGVKLAEAEGSVFLIQRLSKLDIYTRVFS